MSVTAAFRFVQGTTFDVDRAAIGIPSALVTCQWLGDGTPQEWTWTMVSSPTGSVVPLGVFGIGFNPNAYFTPDIPGGYLVELTVIDPVTGQAVTTQLAFLVPELSGRIIPPFRATPQSLRTAAQVSDLQVQGWHPLMEEWLRFLESGGAGGGGADNILGNQIQRVATTPLYTIGDKLQVVVGAKPHVIIQSSNGFLMVLRIEARNVVVYDETNSIVSAMIVLPHREKPVGMVQVGTDVFIASDAGTIYKYDSTYALVGTFPTAAPVNPNGAKLCMVATGGYVFSILDSPAVWDGLVHRLNVTTGAITTAAVSNAYGMVVDGLGSVWIGSENITGTMSVMNASTMAITSFTVPGFLNTRPLLSVSGKMVVSHGTSGNLKRYTEGVTPAFDANITGFASIPAIGAAYHSGGNVAVIYFGASAYAGCYLLPNPNTAVVAGINANTPADTNYQSAVYSDFATRFVLLDAKIDTAVELDLVGGINNYFPVGGLLGFAP